MNQIDAAKQLQTAADAMLTAARGVLAAHEANPAVALPADLSRALDKLGSTWAIVDKLTWVEGGAEG